MKHLCIALAILAQAALFAANVPVEWTADVGSLAIHEISARRGETLDLAVTLKHNGGPFTPLGDWEIFYQTNGMGSAYFTFPVSISGNVARISFTPKMDPGGDRLTGFIGCRGVNYRAAFALRFYGSPGASPNSIPLPVQTLDFAAVAWTNAPWAAAEDIAHLATKDEALLSSYYPGGNITNIAQITTEGISYDVGSDGGATVTGYTGSATDIVIPWKTVIDGVERKVTVLMDGAFEGKSITSIVAPTTIKTIGMFVFRDCASLTSAYFPSVLFLSDEAFNSCKALVTISLPNVGNVSQDSFSYCKSLKSISLPKATWIGNAVFSGCTSLKSVLLPSAKVLGSFCFNSCSSLLSISLPAVTSIGSGAFLKMSLEIVDFGASPRDAVPTIDTSAFLEVPTTCRIIIPLGMYDEWIAADGWSDLYAAGYRFVGYADAAKVVTAPAVTNIARAVVNTVWDDKLGVAWEARMHDGALYYVAVTNRQEVAE